MSQGRFGEARPRSVQHQETIDRHTTTPAPRGSTRVAHVTPQPSLADAQTATRRLAPGPLSAEPDVGTAFAACRAAAVEARAAYAFWCAERGVDSYAVYRACADRADTAQHDLAQLLRPDADVDSRAHLSAPAPLGDHRLTTVAGTQNTTPQGGTA